MGAARKRKRERKLARRSLKIFPLPTMSADSSRDLSQPAFLRAKAAKAACSRARLALALKKAACSKARLRLAKRVKPAAPGEKVALARSADDCGERNVCARLRRS